jgi:proteasome accessory factor B
LPEKIDQSERLFNLTCALLYSSAGLTKQEILSRVQGYKEDYDWGGDNASLERLFERDKANLTAMGVHWIVENPVWAMEDNQEFRYRILNEVFNWPKKLKLTSRQVALLNLAAEVWSRTSLSAVASQGIMRIRALAPAEPGFDILGIAPSIRTHSASFAPLTEALEQHEVVEFQYRKATEDQPTKRTVRPWALEQIDGQWLLLCWDEVRKEPRNFLLKRITSTIKRVGRQFEAPTKAQLEAMQLDLVEHTKRQVADLRVKPNTMASFHFGLPERSAVGEQQEHSIRYMDLHLLAEDLLEYALDIEVLRPKELRDAMVSALEKVASQHYG